MLAISQAISLIFKKGMVKTWSGKFYSDCFFVDWKDLLKTDELNVDSSTQMYLDKANMLLDTNVLKELINTSWNGKLNLG